MDGENLRSLSRVLLYGSPDTRRRAAERLVADPDPDLWPLLARTVTADGPWLLRARSLEVLGIAAGCAAAPVVESILAALETH